MSLLTGRSPLLPAPEPVRPFLGRFSAAQLFVLSFLAMIAVGTLGFLVIPGLYVGEGLGFVDALFTATSAVCVTGLIVVDTATYFTPLGQAWVLLLIQAGGLGILTFTTVVAILLGRRSGLHVEEVAGGHASYLRHVQTGSLVRTVVRVTFFLEGVGAVLLWLGWQGEMGRAAALWPAVFHAVSAFCNAGFSVFPDSLMSYQGAPGVIGVVAVLVVVGGLGFVVLEDLRARWVSRRTTRLSLHTRLVLTVSALLIVVSWLLFLGFEWRFELAHLPVLDRITNAGFMAVTPRTAGFNTVDYGAVTNPSLFLTILLMLVGGAPGSTAGGFKVTTFALLLLLLRSRLKGEEEVSVFDRTIPRETIQRAAGLVVGGLVILAIWIFVLSITELPVAGAGERAAFLGVVFEAHSALGTVGLSMGTTPDLTTLGRLGITALMFLGRVGPAAVVAAMTVALREPKPHYRFGHEDVIVG